MIKKEAKAVPTPQHQLPNTLLPKRVMECPTTPHPKEMISIHKQTFQFFETFVDDTLISKIKLCGLLPAIQHYYPLPMETPYFPRSNHVSESDQIKPKVISSV